MDTSRLCRSCMKEVSSWERENFDERITYMFTYCTNIEIAENDMLPKQFCNECTIKIESSYTYIKEARHTNETLTNLLTERTIIVDPTNTELTPDDQDYSGCDDNPNNTFAINEIIEPVNSAAESAIKAQSKECTEKESEKHMCAVCKKTFLSKVWYEKHMRNHHSGKVYICSQCPKSFERASQLSAHAVTHSAERRYACACGKRYKRRKELAAHARTHAAARPFQCDHCSMSFKLKSVLKSHLVVHQPDKPHLCYVCGWSFKQAGNLSVHMRTHTGVRAHRCACGHRAASAAGLRRHEARHRAPRAHPCRACAKAFHDKAALARHERSHTGARPYQCPGCPRAFVDSWKRKLHLMRAHRVPLARIPRMRADPAILVGQ